MGYNEKLPEWNDPGIEPPQSKKDEGFKPGEKPPAQWFNWLLNKIYLSIRELREKTVEKIEGKGLSSNDYTLEEKIKLGGISKQATKVESSAINGNIKIDGVQAKVYEHPASHPASIIEESTTKRFMSDAEKNSWNGKETPTGAQAKATAALAAANSYTDQEIGGKTIDDTLIPSIDTGLSVKILLSWLANMIKSITGKSSWRVKPTRNMEELNTAIGNKVDKVAGKHLSDMNYTIGDSMKLEGIEAGANKYVHPGSHPASMISGLPTSLPASGGNADTIGWLAPSAFMNAVNAGGSDVDPNTTAESFILTNHANSPGGGIYWHILTTFYASKTRDSNKGQIAISYNGSAARLMCRHYFAPTWTPWVELMPLTGGTILGVLTAQSNALYTTRQVRNMIYSTADPSGGLSGDMWVKYKP